MSPIQNVLGLVGMSVPVHCAPAAGAEHVDDCVAELIVGDGKSIEESMLGRSDSGRLIDDFDEANATLCAVAVTVRTEGTVVGLVNVVVVVEVAVVVETRLTSSLDEVDGGLFVRSFVIGFGREIDGVFVDKVVLLLSTGLNFVSDSNRLVEAIELIREMNEPDTVEALVNALLLDVFDDLALIRPTKSFDFGVLAVEAILL